MHSFIRVNGKEAFVEGVRPIDLEFNDKVVSELRKFFGEKAQFNISPVANFINEDQTDNIFSGIITGQFESEAPISIDVFLDIAPIESFDSAAEMPEPDMTIPAFIGFRK